MASAITSLLVMPVTDTCAGSVEERGAVTEAPNFSTGLLVGVAFGVPVAVARGVFVAVGVLVAVGFGVLVAVAFGVLVGLGVAVGAAMASGALSARPAIPAVRTEAMAAVRVVFFMIWLLVSGA
ncbi:hypothetical protein [Enemella evansiae]|uniref:hypothetical protein n=1 Tax=Enemella evansiae TaxID=2016499 RepID=UPI00117CA02D|nr:hypothetical protein [Enemella evansiae]